MIAISILIIKKVKKFVRLIAKILYFYSMKTINADISIFKIILLVCTALFYFARFFFKEDKVVKSVNDKTKKNKEKKAIPSFETAVNVDVEENHRNEVLDTLINQKLISTIDKNEITTLHSELETTIKSTEIIKINNNDKWKQAFIGSLVFERKF
jgi:hypothetical protein